MSNASANYNLHAIGWKSFQDLSIAVAEECLKRPVQSFLPVADAGRDGAFIGRWDEAGPYQGSSTIQCKHSSNERATLTLASMSDELKKVHRLVQQGLADDYIIITNCRVTARSDAAIKAAFQAIGVQHCRVFGKNWLVDQILKSPRLRMMVPRLYGLGDLSQILDSRAYEQAELVLSAMDEREVS